MSALTFVNVSDFWQQMQQSHVDVKTAVSAIDYIDAAGYQLLIKLLEDKKITQNDLSEQVLSDMRFLGWIAS
jgi:ABC-type transporter Mla MlaB component